MRESKYGDKSICECGHRRMNHAEVDDGGEFEGQFVDYMECLMPGCKCEVYRGPNS